jgi:ribosomal protein S18 acetylase RimI-like enzyme
LIEVRPAESALDLAAMWRSVLRTGRLSLGRGLSKPERAALRARLVSALSDPAQRVVLARRGETPAGGYWFEARPGGVAFVLHVEVERPLRGQGVADELWGALSREAAALGLSEIRLAVSEANARALGFYARHGLEVSEAETREGRSWLELRGPVAASREAPTPPRSGSSSRGP